MPRILPKLVSLILLALAARAHAYVDLAPTLAKVMNDSTKIALVEVVEVHEQTLILREIRTLKGGEVSTQTVQHVIAASSATTPPRHIVQWARPGAHAVLFSSNTNALVCIGQGWYQVSALTPRSWKIGIDRPDLPLAYYGAVSRLTDAVEAMLAGKDAILTTLPHGATDAASFDLALNRAALPSLVKVQRIRANLKMPPIVMAVSNNSAYLIGQGPVDEKDLPALMEKLKSPDATTRAEAADDLRSLESKAQPAVGGLRQLLADPVSQVQLSAATALLCITPQDAPSLDLLAKSLQSSDPPTRRAAAVACANAAPASASLAAPLAALLKDADASIRIAALQALATLGPAAASQASQIKPLLTDSQLAIDAADALGRIGPAARPIPPELTVMLTSDQPATRWAAVRAMSQIGGDEAKPAIDFMIKSLPTAQEVDLYNMHIYLALLGPTARDAIPAVKSSHLKNPVLPSAALWALSPDQNFPWQMQTRGPGGGPMGPGPGGPGGMDGVDLSKYIYDAFFLELGPRLAPVAQRLTQAILDGSEGDIPTWGYGLLTCDTDASLKTLAPHLADTSLATRERAAVALGYMGPSAASIRPQLESALASAATPMEKRLLQWALRQTQP